MGRVEEVVHDRVPVEHDLVHPAGDLRSLALDHGGGGLQDVDGRRAKRWSHLLLTFVLLFFRSVKSKLDQLLFICVFVSSTVVTMKTLIGRALFLWTMRGGS